MFRFAQHDSAIYETRSKGNRFVSLSTNSCTFVSIRGYPFVYCKPAACPRSRSHSIKTICRLLSRSLFS
jgi:hypothetical protein